jgi:predicted  nucleic acid-binding Zn-ribbon protein
MSKERQTFNAKITQVMTRNQELEAEVEEQKKKGDNFVKEKENLQFQIMDLQMKLNNQTSMISRLTKTERDLRSKIDNNQNRLLCQEEALRKANEENYNLKWEIENIQTDIINMVNVENALRSELTLILDKKKELEESKSKLKSKTCLDTIALRHLANENEQFKSEISCLKENISHLQAENIDLKQENEDLKQKIWRVEKQNNYLRNSESATGEIHTWGRYARERTSSVKKTRGEEHRRFVEFQKSYEDEKEDQQHMNREDPRGQMSNMGNTMNNNLKEHSLTHSKSSSNLPYKNKANFSSLSEFVGGSDLIQNFETKPVENSNGSNDAKKLEFLNRQLQELVEKIQMLESDYWRLPIVVNQSVQRKKEYLERELDQATKDISSVKRKIREWTKNNQF